MKNYLFLFSLQLVVLTVDAQQIGYKNIWSRPPSHIPNNVSVDAPLMGNGDVTMSVGYKENCLRYYLSKNDFWRLCSQADRLSGPRVAGLVNITIEGFNDASFTAEQSLQNGLTTCFIKKEAESIQSKSWVSATDNLVFIELTSIQKEAYVSVHLTAPENRQAVFKSGKLGNIYWLMRSFEDSVDIKTNVAISLKVLNSQTLQPVLLKPGQKITIAIAMESGFKKKDPVDCVVTRMKTINENSKAVLLTEHNQWWDSYWNKSSIVVDDTVLMKAYYQGLYTMAACSRDRKFPPGIFGWTTTDDPGWNGDYHLNYNFQAPFYCLAAANRITQLDPHDAPLLDFINRGKWYAQNVTNTRGILYPVGIGPLGIEVTRNFPIYEKESGGLFWGQRSNAVYCLINMAQRWRCTYDKKYGQKIYPYTLEVVNFWEDYLKLENGRYVIYGDAIHEGSGKDKNPILSLGLIRNAFDLIIDLSSTLKIDENRQAKWKEILSKLSDFPVQIRNNRKVFRYTEEGVAWWDGNGLGIQHIYPANAITLSSDTSLIKVAYNTIDEMKRWQDLNTSNSFFMAAIRIGYDPLVIMQELHNYALHTYPNGFQLNNPHGIENSCTVANALMEMMCMSAGNVIRLFAGFSRTKNVQFNNIRAWGAFLISARMTNGVISDVKIVSEKGKPCDIINPWPDKKIIVIRNGKRAETINGNRLSFRTAINETIEMKAI